MAKGRMASPRTPQYRDRMFDIGTLVPIIPQWERDAEMATRTAAIAVVRDRCPDADLMLEALGLVAA